MIRLPGDSGILQNQGRAVVLRHVSKSYDGRPAVADLSLEVRAGEFLAIIGPSGSGKTTTMRIIGGFEPPDDGQVLIAGADVTAVPAEARRVNTVFQSYALFPHMTVLDNVAFGPRMRGVGRRARNARAREMLELVRLPEAAARRPGELSGGMQQRVALARALANEPAVLLLDEPLGALDRKLREDMQRELRRVQTALGATFIYVTHDQEEAFGMADRVAIMRDGRLVQLGDPASIYDAPATAWAARFLGSANEFTGRLTAAGPPARIETALGTLEAGRIAPGIAPGDAVVALVRPEATRLEPATGAAGPNRIPVRLLDRVTLGADLRLSAVAGDGHEVEALMPRTQAPPESGDALAMTFDAAAVLVYADDRDQPSSSTPAQRSIR